MMGIFIMAKDKVLESIDTQTVISSKVSGKMMKN